jgi:hypothetical protein
MGAADAPAPPPAPNLLLQALTAAFGGAGPPPPPVATPMVRLDIPEPKPLSPAVASFQAMLPTLREVQAYQQHMQRMGLTPKPLSHFAPAAATLLSLSGVDSSKYEDINFVLEHAASLTTTTSTPPPRIPVSLPWSKQMRDLPPHVVAVVNWEQSERRHRSQEYTARAYADMVHETIPGLLDGIDTTRCTSAEQIASAIYRALATTSPETMVAHLRLVDAIEAAAQRIHRSSPRTTSGGAGGGSSGDGGPRHGDRGDRRGGDRRGGDGDRRGGDGGGGATTGGGGAPASGSGGAGRGGAPSSDGHGRDTHHRGGGRGGYRGGGRGGGGGGGGGSAGGSGSGGSKAAIAAPVAKGAGAPTASTAPSAAAPAPGKVGGIPAAASPPRAQRATSAPPRTAQPPPTGGGWAARTAGSPTWVALASGYGMTSGRRSPSPTTAATTRTRSSGARLPNACRLSEAHASSGKTA